MEHLKSGDFPALVTNIEVMNLLSNRLTNREQEEKQVQGASSATLSSSSSSIENKRKQHPKLRHRDYIEKSVFEYISSGPCKNVDVHQMPTLVSTLRGRRRRETNRQTIKAILKEEEQEEERNSIKTEEITLQQTQQQEPNIDQGKDDGYGLTDAETLQILNHLPTEPVEMHLMIEDLANRLDENEQNDLLELIKKHTQLLQL
jgi:hypothetical protein